MQQDRSQLPSRIIQFTDRQYNRFEDPLDCYELGRHFEEFDILTETNGPVFGHDNFTNDRSDDNGSQEEHSGHNNHDHSNPNRNVSDPNDSDPNDFDHKEPRANEQQPILYQRPSSLPSSKHRIPLPRYFVDQGQPKESRQQQVQRQESQGQVQEEEVPQLQAHHQHTIPFTADQEQGRQQLHQLAQQPQQFQQQQVKQQQPLQQIQQIQQIRRSEGQTQQEAQQQALQVQQQIQQSAYARHSEASILSRITISDDQTSGSQFTERLLLALKSKDILVKNTNLVDNPNDLSSQHIPIGGFPSFHTSQASSGNHALQDYQTQLMLLERQNKKRLLMERELESAMTQQRIEPRQHNEEQNGLQDQVIGEQMIRRGSESSFIKRRDLPPTNSLNVIHSSRLHPAHENGENATLDLQTLQNYIRTLEEKAQALQDLQRQKEPSRFQILHRIKSGKGSTTYFDFPEWVNGQNGLLLLQGSLPMSNFSSFHEKHKDIAFVVYRDYDRHLTTSFEDEDSVPPVRHVSESIYPASKDLHVAVTTILESRSEFADFLSWFKEKSELPAPYLFMYHTRSHFETLISEMPEKSKRQVRLLSDHIQMDYGSEYAAVDSLLAKRRISIAYIRYLFKPNDVLVHLKKGKVTAYVSKSWPLVTRVKDSSDIYTTSAMNHLHSHLQGSAAVNSSKGMTSKGKVSTWEIHAWSWAFDGRFRREPTQIRLEIATDDESEKDIADLNVYPLRFASAQTIKLLRQRGETFWKCRYRHLVSYDENNEGETHKMTDERYMIDMKTYEELHPRQYPTTTSAEVLGPYLMSQATPPDNQFTLLLPLTIKAYNLRRKKWLDLQVDRISETTWNKEAFMSLVLDRKTKDLIQALVSNQLAAEKSTDLISGKGNGLILLLHGGPGTGKTLTADIEYSVAEIAEKPLYRVTCGDVGTEAEDVEKYLESVLHLGKIWGCVVLLDEADIFLEQRSLEDLKRNALVSVFLRVLEYYDGILILTSNRVGIFDEAFKSRIQLALHYADLGVFQRLRIWENFISRLESLGEKDIDFADIKDHFQQLAEEKMNGRQIRNAITTARQYAQWKKSTLTYERLKEVIEISGRFDKYIDKLNGGCTQEQLAEEDGLRLAQAP